MNKQILKIEETIDWLEKNSPDDASIIIMAMSDLPQDSETPIIEKRNVELKTFIQGYDEDISYMLVQKMINIPLMRQIFAEALAQVNINIDIKSFSDWREKNKYDNKFEPIELPQPEEPVIDGEPAEYIKKFQDFCTWMNDKPSRNLTLLAFTHDELNSDKTTFAMGFAPDISVLLVQELKDNYNFRNILESSLLGLEMQASFEEYMAWKEYLKKKTK